jgi:hypothetical protein
MRLILSYLPFLVAHAIVTMTELTTEAITSHAAKAAISPWKEGRFFSHAQVRALHHLRQGRSSEFLNVGTGRGYSVFEVVECISRVTGKSI